jgi:hypothetical protein
MQVGGRPVRGHGVRPAGHDCRHDPAIEVEPPPTDRVDASVDSVQAAVSGPLLHRSSPQPHAQELRKGDDPMLLVGQLGDHRIGVRVEFPHHWFAFRPAPFTAAMLPPGVLRR